MIWETAAWDAAYWAGVLVLTSADAPNDPRKVQLRDGYGRNVTLKSWRACVKSHGVDRSAETFWKLGVQ